MKSKEIKIYNQREIFADEMLKKYVDNIHNKIVSDIGSGFGLMKESIENKGFIWQPFDYVRKIPEATIRDLNDLAPDGAKKPTGVVLLEVLEHFGNPMKAIENIAAHMEQEGVLILTTPNPQSSKNTLNLFLKGSLFAFQPKHLKEHHVFTPWEHIVRFFLEDNGFEIKEYAIVDVEYRDRKPKNIKDFFKKRLERFIEMKNPKAKGMSYGMVAVKKS